MRRIKEFLKGQRGGIKWWEALLILLATILLAAVCLLAGLMHGRGYW